MRIDKKDHEIISVLKENSRASVRQIAKTTGIRPSTVHQRIQKLRETGVIENFTVKLNNRAVNENFIVFVLATTEADLTNEILSNASVKEAHGITGEYDLLLKLKFANVEEFNDFILRFRKKVKVQKTLTMVSTIGLKEILN
ncbi:MAG: Lrp/AsnC family transcriptional regulator [archaeon]